VVDDDVLRLVSTKDRPEVVNYLAEKRSACR